GEHGDARDAAIGLEMMQVNMQQRRARRLDAVPQRRLDMRDVVQPFGIVQIDDEMRAGAAHPVPHHEMIVTLIFDDGRYDRVLLSGGTWSPQALDRLKEGVLAHAVLPNLRSKPQKPASRLTERECRKANLHTCRPAVRR